MLVRTSFSAAFADADDTRKRINIGCAYGTRLCLNLEKYSGTLR